MSHYLTGIGPRRPLALKSLVSRCQSSPKTHHTRINCPTLLFHAEDDSIVDIKTTREFAKLLQQHNQNVTVQTVPTGDHYESMINQGIPAGVEWIKQQR